MADLKISQLNELTTPSGSDVLAIVNDGETKKIQVNNLVSGTSVNTGSFYVDSSMTGSTLSFVRGDGTTDSVNITSASYAISASYAVSASVEISYEISSSYAETSSLATTASYANLADVANTASYFDLPDNIVSSSQQIASDISGSTGALSASIASDIAELTTSTLISSSQQIATDVSGAFTDTSASIASDIFDLSSSLNADSSSIALDIAQNSQSIADLSASAATDRGNFVRSIDSVSDNKFTFTKGNSTVATITIETGSFVKTVNTSAPDASGNVGVSFGSTSTGLSSSFPASPDDADIYIISGETAPDRTGSNGQVFIYATGSNEWFKITPPDESVYDLKYVNVGGDTMTGKLTVDGNLDPAIEIKAPAANSPTLAFNQDAVATSKLFVETSSPYALKYTDSTKTNARNIKAANPVDSDDLTTKQYTDDTFVTKIDFNASTASYYESSSVVDNVITFNQADGTTEAITVHSASYAVSASHADMATSASYAITASHAVMSTTSSFAMTASYVNPLVQNVQLTGSLLMSSSIEMNDFRINGLIRPSSSHEATNKEYVDGIKLDTQYDVFDLSLDTAFSKDYTGYDQCISSTTFVSASRVFAVVQRNNNSVEAIRELDIENEVLLGNTDTVTKAIYPRAKGVFEYDGDFYINAAYSANSANGGSIQVSKWDGSDLTIHQSITGQQRSAEQNSQTAFCQDPDDQNKGIFVNASLDVASTFNVYKWVNGSWETTIAESISAPRPNNPTTSVACFNGNFYIALTNGTTESTEIWEFNYATDVATKLMDLPAKSNQNRQANELFVINGILHLADGNRGSAIKIYEIYPDRNSYLEVAQSTYVSNGISGAGLFGKGDDATTQVAYFAVINFGSTANQYFYYDAVEKQIVELGTQSLPGGPYAPSMILGGNNIFPLTPCYTSDRYRLHKLESSYSVGTLLAADNGSWRTTDSISSAVQLPVGTTSQRPAPAAQGMIRFNSTTSSVEYYNGTTWVSLT